MIKLILATLLLATTAQSLARTSPQGIVPLHAASYGESVREYSIIESQAEKLAKWDPAQTAAPLTTSQAITKARAWLKVRHPKFDGFEPTEISLRRVSYSRFTALWYYTIRFDGLVGQTRSYVPEMEAVVLMDGTVVEPKRGKP